MTNLTSIDLARASAAGDTLPNRNLMELVEEARDVIDLFIDGWVPSRRLELRAEDVSEALTLLINLVDDRRGS